MHLDVDLYHSTLAGLRFFYPRLNPGGIIISHDYSFIEGVRRAINEFLADKPETAIELPTSQCMIVKLPAAAANEDAEVRLLAASTSEPPIGVA